MVTGTDLENIFDMVGETVDAVTSGAAAVPENGSAKGSAIAAILDGGPPEGAASEIVVIEIDAQIAAKLNKYVQSGLAKLYEMAGGAAERMCESIEAGDTDARTIEGTARLVESATKALSEINRYSMFLQEQMVDMRVRNEIENLRLQAEKMRTETTREALLSALAEADNVQKDKDADGVVGLHDEANVE